MSESCKDILNLIPMYIDTSLDTKESDRVAEHINSCEKCHAEFMLMSSVMKKTRELPDIKVSSDFHDNLMQKVRKQQAEKHKKRIALLRRSSMGVAAAAVVALSVVGFSNLKNAPTDIDTQSPVLSVPEVKKTEATDNKEPTKVHTTQEKASSPQKTETTAPENSAETVPSEVATTDAEIAVVCDDLSCIKSVITTDDTNREEIMEILSQYEKDEIGYIVPDINTVIKKLSELGVEVSTQACEYPSNYIIIK